MDGRLGNQILKLINQEKEAQRLDKYLTGQITELSRSRLQGLIRDGFIRVNDQQAVKNGQTVFPGDHIEVIIPPPVPTDLEPQDIPLDIVFENDDLILINKPPGMVVHPSAGHDRDTLVHAVLAHAPEIEGIGGEIRPGVVHRLDKDTSGLIIIAKNDRTLRWLQDQFRLRKVEKTYLALVDGAPPTPAGRVEAPIGRDPSHRKKMAVLHTGKGREAISEYSTVKAYHHHTLLQVKLLTGRTHQIRLHLAFIGCPLVGDTLYGHRHPSLPAARQFLHAYRLRITFPGETEQRTFEASLPKDLADILEMLE
ncbi:MAG: RluA family pseudouridine synthase [Chloroflexi bacterium]|nr:RluA family pseudouridine synthase [Chloroflexota bacterium]